jgi:hypothetical protein
MSFSACAYCGGHCTPHGDPDSHGICDHCLAEKYPAWPASKRHADAMRRGAEAFARGPVEQLKRLEKLGEKEA